MNTYSLTATEVNPPSLPPLFPLKKINTRSLATSEVNPLFLPPLSLPKKIELCHEIKIPAESSKYIVYNGYRFALKYKGINRNRHYCSFY